MNLKSQIIELRSNGCSYPQIKEKLGCSKGTIAFHCNAKVREKAIKRHQRNRKANPLRTKIEAWRSGRKKIINEHQKTLNEVINKSINIKLQQKMSQFFIDKQTKKYGDYMFTTKQLLEKIGPNPVCYLTGEPIDLNKSRTYHLDHIVPKSRGGDDSLDNCQIACREANQAKGDLFLEEFVALCKKVVKRSKN